MDSQLQIRDIGKDRWMWAGLCFVFALLAFLSPAWPGNAIEHYLGELLIWAGIIELYDAFRRSESAGRTSARWGGVVSLLMATLLVNAILLQPKALYLFIVVLFGLDALRYVRGFFRLPRGSSGRWFILSAGIVNLLLVASMFFWEEKGQALVLSIAIGIRLAGTGLSLLAAKVGLLGKVDEDVTEKIGLKGDPYVTAIAERIKQEEETSARYDRRWIITFIVLLFIIHLGRMGLDRTFLGILSPLVATVGDIVIALIVTYAILAPLRILLLRLMRQRAQRLWSWIAQVEEKDRRWYHLRNLAAHWLSIRIRAEVRFIKAGYSMPTAIRTGLKIGLPWAALLVAVMPVLGMSWYFDTENWASGIWDKWAANRADVWRMAMIRSSGEDLSESSFRVHPEGVSGSGDFSFVVIGDTGEGDASQLVLKDQLVEVSNHPDVKFVMISSDVVYPTGALRDYEKKFWLPFKGVKKPVYAIPGNHDWYDALDGFVATFFEPDAARKAMRARAAADLKLTSSTQTTIDDAIQKTEFWRNQYQVLTGFQKAPFFQVSTDNFVLITLETGVERQIDSLQRHWLRNVLDASRNKFVMVVLGHPFYAIGEYQGKLNPKFEDLHDLLKSYHVPLVMAGDTHDLEYYQEPHGDTRINHFVNGGGGAYLSIGAQMTKPENMPTSEYAFYPSREPLVAKIEANTKWYKRPAWWWTTALDGWPFSAEWLSAMFDYNVSPYFQSFIKITVSPSQKRVTLIPYSNNGRLRWRDLTSTQGARPEGATPDDLVAWMIEMK
jgi:uncharacterized membrane protein HdeD (DUF308 family)/3',5'-cyclic AMP phosphodiesterase CpdA